MDVLDRRSVVVNLLSLFLSLAVAVVVTALLPAEWPSGPRTLQRGIGVVVFFTTYTLLFVLSVSRER